MTGQKRPKLSYDQREAGSRAGLASGRFRWQSRGERIVCTFCGRKGWPSGSWIDACIQGHPFTCGCGRAFASRQALAAHRRHVPACKV